MNETIAYKVMTFQEFEQLQRDGQSHGTPADVADGFIHMSTGTQIAATIQKHYLGRSDVLLLVVDITKLGNAVRWKTSRGNELFPHLHGVLPLESIISVSDIIYSEDGSLQVPK